jgi:hypothetical protein
VDDVQRARAAIAKAGGLVTPKELAQEWGVSEQAIADRILRGTFADPVKVAGRTRLYLHDEAARYMTPNTLAKLREELERLIAFGRRSIAEAGDESDEDVGRIREQVAGWQAQLARLPDEESLIVSPRTPLRDRR